MQRCLQYFAFQLLVASHHAAHSARHLVIAFCASAALISFDPPIYFCFVRIPSNPRSPDHFRAATVSSGFKKLTGLRLYPFLLTNCRKTVTFYMYWLCFPKISPWNKIVPTPHISWLFKQKIINHMGVDYLWFTVPLFRCLPCFMPIMSDGTVVL